MKIETRITSDIKEAAEFLRAGDLVAFPTETVYGLGADVFNRQAVEKIFIAKGRPRENPLIVHVGAVKDVESVCLNISAQARSFMKAFFPGPLTLILERNPAIPSIVSAGRPTVGVRMPDSDVAVKFIMATETLVAAPSANLSGKPSPTTWSAVHEDLDGKIRCILQGEMSDVGLESTVVDCTVDPPEILRPGSITLSDLQRIVAVTRFSIGAGSEQPTAPRSPGMAYIHYTPAASVIVIDHIKAAVSEPGNAFIGLDTPTDVAAFGLVYVAPGIKEYARTLFEFFRRCDRAGIEVIYCQSVVNLELGRALMDRINRAAAK